MLDSFDTLLDVGIPVRGSSPERDVGIIVVDPRVAVSIGPELGGQPIRYSCRSSAAVVSKY